MPKLPPFGRQAPEALERLGAKLHELIEQSLRTVDDHDAYPEDVAWAVEQLEAVAARLGRHTRDTRLALGDRDDGRAYYVRGVTIGPHHPMYIPIELETTDGVTRGQVALDIAWEGPPGHVHGGYVAHLFDVVMGQHNLNTGIPGMTGTLTIRYRRPTPLHVPLDFEVHTDSASGRKVVVKATLASDGDPIADAEGLFIVPASFTVHLRR